MVRVPGFRARGERALCLSGLVDGGEGVEGESTGKAVGKLPWIANRFDAQRAAIMRAGARVGCAAAEESCSEQSAQRELSYRARQHSRPRSEGARRAGR